MKSEFKDQIREKLFTMKADVLKTLIAENNDFRAAIENSGVKDLGDVASNDIDVWILEAVGTQDRQRLQRVEAALSRLENGKFGVCAGCGKKIDIDRLKAIPYAVMCFPCQQNLEKRQMR